MQSPVEPWEVTLDRVTVDKNGKTRHHRTNFYRKGYAPLGVPDWYRMRSMGPDTVYEHPDDAVVDASEQELRAIARALKQALKKHSGYESPHLTVILGGKAA